MRSSRTGGPMTSMPVRLSQGLAGFLVAASSVALLGCDQSAPGAGRHATEPITTASPQPSSPASEPVVTLDPDSGPVGTRIQVSGSGFSSDLASQHDVIVTLNREFAGGCGLVGGVRVKHLNIAKNGDLTAELVIKARGDCFQEPGRHHAVTPGQYEVAIGCMACNVRSFEVTRS